MPEILYIKFDCCHLNWVQIWTLSVLPGVDPGLGLCRPLAHTPWNCSDIFPDLMSACECGAPRNWCTLLTLSTAVAMMLYFVLFFAILGYSLSTTGKLDAWLFTVYVIKPLYISLNPHAYSCVVTGIMLCEFLHSSRLYFMNWKICFYGIYLFIYCGIFNDAISSWDCLVSNSRMRSEQQIGKVVEGSSHGLI